MFVGGRNDEHPARFDVVFVPNEWVEFLDLVRGGAEFFCNGIQGISFQDGVEFVSHLSRKFDVMSNLEAVMIDTRVGLLKGFCSCSELRSDRGESVSLDGIRRHGGIFLRSENDCLNRIVYDEIADVNWNGRRIK